MTQEELDALMDGDVEELDSLSDDEIDSSSDEDLNENAEVKESPKENDTSHHLPLPATDEHKMVHQLDDVTKESEEKASEIFDIIEGISTDLLEKEKNANNVIEVLNSNIELFTTLSEKFPDVEAFKIQLEKNNSALNETTEALEMLQTSGDSIMNVMDIMQYQDIHRQKIERVINVMRALSNYMNSLFEGKIDDSKRASSAQHIVGDTHDDIASVDDIEALLAQFGQK
ncbi:MAG: chemotaxis protein [Sulfurimonas sp.]|uniref:chemotaxis protein n=1 Tax=Sulfurimonas sp. TaxID=2022749 RepID=UPI0026024D3B|nr:chemotaxis protein [Sulfurimonas sp.]MCW8895641.1 chemotaxis protein [Sulfurimonas sp.]MCW8954643.1 chemotaxis protein [Sulfurimonas sp.]MCW9067085.1 chemotaxis protein [Sulfurimonas sp.]